MAWYFRTVRLKGAYYCDCSNCMFNIRHGHYPSIGNQWDRSQPDTPQICSMVVSSGDRETLDLIYGYPEWRFPLVLDRCNIESEYAEFDYMRPRSVDHALEWFSNRIRSDHPILEMLKSLAQDSRIWIEKS